MTIQGLEGYLKGRELTALNRILIQNHEALYEGRYSVREEVNRNIGEYIGDSLKYALGIRLQILVKTRDDHILYPTLFKRETGDFEDEDDFSVLPHESLDYTEVAAENYRILNEGLVVSVDVRVRHNGWLSNSILVLYVFASLFVLRVFIRRGLRESERQESQQKARIKGLSLQLGDMEARLKDVKSKESVYEERISGLKKEKGDLSRDIDGLLEELERLETGLENQRHLKEDLEVEVLDLREQIDQLKGKLERPKHKKKKKETISKRFKVLYKNLDFSDRAVEGFLSLTDEFQLKAEAIIHQLNEDDTSISVKRKVFGKGGKLNVLETDFSYSGRIYFQKDAHSRCRIVAIGTKNTQERDLTYLETLK
ncbi:MAG: hypothetical protein ACOWYE_12085 [Desulfatiglandales bacterium]